jgi:hypothetical protein
LVAFRDRHVQAGKTLAEPDLAVLARHLYSIARRLYSTQQMHASNNADVSPLIGATLSAELRTCTGRYMADIPGPLRRALVAELVRSLVPPEGVMSFIEARMTDEVQPQHRDKFKQDVLAELDNLDISRMAGLGITREQLEAWLNLRTPQSSSQL